MKMTQEELSEILKQHAIWLLDSSTGKRANLYNANLSNANLSNANLRGADLSNADLYNADLYNANLYNANLYNANLYNANLSSADLSTVRGVTYATVGWTGHGECGRTLNAVIIKDTIMYFCGCFKGNKQDILTYIREGEDKHKKSRMRAYRFVTSCLSD